MNALRVGALWCPSCLIMRPRWDKVFLAHPDLTVEDIDFDKQPARIEELRVGTILPVVILFRDGREIARVTGEKTAKELVRWAEEWLR